MYSQIDSNRRKTWILTLMFIGVLAAIGYIYGYVTDTGYGGLVFALIISVVMTGVSWFAGDKIALAASHAEELTDRAQFPTLWNTVENLATTAGTPMPKIYVVEDPSPNAFATGRDPAHASVAVTTGLLAMMNKTELGGVLAHELSHVKNLDIRLMMMLAVLVGAIIILGNSLFRFGGFRRRRSDREGGDLAGLLMIFGIVFIILSPLISNLIKLAISRQREYLADASGALLTRYPEGLASALEKIRDAHIPLQYVSGATQHLWIANPTEPSGFRARLAQLTSTHPPIDDRINRLRGMIDKA